MKVSTPKVFISYRREETSAHAGRVHDAMVERFGEESVFMDIELEPGVDFVERITQAVAACHVLLVVMGPKWATLSNGDSRARLADPQDFVRLEVETALRRDDVRVIPLLVAGAAMPDADDLPDGLRPLTRRQALDLSDVRWRYDIGRLIVALEELLDTSPAPPGAGHPEPIAPHPGPPPEAATLEPSPVAEPAPPPPAPPPPPTPHAPPPRRRRLLAAAAGAAALILAVVAIALVAGGGDSPDAGADGETQPRVTDRIRLGPGAAPDGIAIDGDRMWVTDQERNVVWPVDTSTGDVGDPSEVGTDPDGVAAANETLWVANVDDSSVTRLELSADGAVTGSQDLVVKPAGVTRPEGLALSEQWVWVTAGRTGDVARIDRASGTFGDPIHIGADTVGLEIAGEGVYVSDEGDHAVTRLDASSGRRDWGPTTVGNEPRGIVEAEGTVWVANAGEHSVSRIDASTGNVIGEPIKVGLNPRDLTYADGFVWVANTSAGTVTRIDAGSGRVVGEAIQVGREPASIVAGDGSVWVSLAGEGTVARIEL
jgi:DNA-binding beta-propeller fold protein YncE